MEPRKLSLADLREIVDDPVELAKGAGVFDGGGLQHLARFERRLFADAAAGAAGRGSRPTSSAPPPYKVQIHFEERGVRGRCSCMAARTRPFCKHAAALLVAWAQTPDAFAEAPEPPGLADARKKRVRTGKVEANALMARGVEQVTTLVRELAVAGVRTLAEDRADQVRALGATLRELRLRRLSARTLELAAHLDRAAARDDAFDVEAWAELLGDMLLTARKIEKHLGGEELAREHVEELIGKTWTKKDRAPIEGLELLEYAFSARTTSDDFVIRESRFFELASGEHYTEKQILPAFLAKRTPSKPSWAGQVLGGAAGSLYPTFSPRRLDLSSPGQPIPLDGHALTRAIDRALPTVGAALSALQERRRDVFAPELLPVALRADTIFASGARLRVVDPGGAALFLPDDPDAEDALARVLREARLLALFGDVALDGVLPTLFPVAAILESPGGRSLIPLGAADAAAILGSKKLRRLERKGGARSRWIDVARATGASAAAIILGEVREELADALAAGLGSVVPRFCAPLAARLVELRLTKQAELLTAIGARAEPAEKLEELIKLHQVLGIALARLASAPEIDRAAIEAAPTYESVFVPRIEHTRPPAEVAAEQGAGRMNRYEAAVHHARWFAELDPELLASELYPTWADGSAAPHVAAALARHPELAVQAARRVLEPGGPTKAGRATARTAKLTAIRVLARAGTAEARAVLERTAKLPGDPALAAQASKLLGRSEGESTRSDAGERQRLSARALNAPQAEARVEALRALAKGAFVEAIPIMRASFAADVSAKVREEAGYALAEIGDVDSAETFVRALRRRIEDPAAAQAAARALGRLGDARGLEELLAALEAGWHRSLVVSALAAIGATALEPLLDRAERSSGTHTHPAATALLRELPGAETAPIMIAHLAAAPEERFPALASLYLKLAKDGPEARRALARQILEVRPELREVKGLPAELKALARACARAAGPAEAGEGGA